MKRIPNILLVTILIIAGYHGNGQEVSISRATEQVILTTTMQTVESYSRYMELFSSETDKDLADIYKAELMKLIEEDSIWVFNDLVPEGDRPPELEQNIDVFVTYLDDIQSRYLDGVSVVYSNFDTSVVYNDTVRSRLFMKITADRSIEGTYHYKNTSKEHEAEEKLDFYIGIILKETGVPESKIYSVMIHQDNEHNFTPVKVVEKSVPIEFAKNQWPKGMKRGREYTLRWEGGEIYERLSLELYRGSKRLNILEQVIDSAFFNDNSIAFTIPEKTRKNDDYYFRVTKLDSEEEPFDTERFMIRRRYPLAMQAAIPVVLGAGVYVAILLAQPEEEPDLPTSPGMPSE